MKKLILTILTALPVIVNAQVKRTPGEFSGIQLSDPINVSIEQGLENSITLEGDSASVASLKTEISNGMLDIETGTNVKPGQIKILVTVKDLSKVIVGGSGDIKGKGTINVNTIEIKASGSGDVKMNLQAKKVLADVQGAGDISLSGNANSLVGSLTGAGDLKAFDLIVDSATINSTGAGDAKINVSKYLNADISGASTVIYKGDPANREIEISGAGSVKQSNESGTVEIGIGVDNYDTTKFKFKDKRIIIIDKNDSLQQSKKSKNGSAKMNKIWEGLELGINGYMTPGNSLNLPAGQSFLDLDYRNSIALNINFWEHRWKLAGKRLLLVTGMGSEFNRYALNNNVTLLNVGDKLGFISTAVDYKKNFLKANYLTVPLYLQTNIGSGKKTWHLAVGVVGGYNFSTYTKQIWEQGDQKMKAKVHDDFQVNPFKASSSVRFGNRNFNVFANYSLVSLFEKRNAPDLYPFSVGIRLLGF